MVIQHNEMVLIALKDVKLKYNKNNMLGDYRDVFGIRLGGFGNGGKVNSASQCKNLRPAEMDWIDFGVIYILKADSERS